MVGELSFKRRDEGVRQRETKDRERAHHVQGLTAPPARRSGEPMVLGDRVVGCEPGGALLIEGPNGLVTPPIAFNSARSSANRCSWMVGGGFGRNWSAVSMVQGVTLAEERNGLAPVRGSGCQ